MGTMRREAMTEETGAMLDQTAAQQGRFDPEVSLRTLRALTSEEGIREVGIGRAWDLAREVFTALDEHLSRGGRLPRHWQSAQERSRRTQAELIDTLHGTNLAGIPERY